MRFVESTSISFALFSACSTMLHSRIVLLISAKQARRGEVENAIAQIEFSQVPLVRGDSAMARTIQEIVANASLLAEVPLVPLKPAHEIPTRALPSIPQRDPSTNPLLGWSIETFVIPAAYPRAFPRQTKRPHEARKDLKPGTREEMLLDLYERQMEAGRTQGAEEDEEGLWMAVNRYMRKKGNEGDGQGLTLVMIHPNGMHKEVRSLFFQLHSSEVGQDTAVAETGLWRIDVGTDTRGSLASR